MTFNGEKRVEKFFFSSRKFDYKRIKKIIGKISLNFEKKSQREKQFIQNLNKNDKTKLK